MTVADTGDLAILIRRRRLELGLTQSGAARQAGLSVTTWQALERTDDARPEAFQELSLSKAARCLHLPLEEVFRAAARPVPGGLALSLLDDVSGGEHAPGAVSHGGGAHSTDPEALLLELDRRLRALLRRRESSFLVLAQQSLTLAEHLLRLHEAQAAESAAEDDAGPAA